MKIKNNNKKNNNKNYKIFLLKLSGEFFLKDNSDQGFSPFCKNKIEKLAELVRPFSEEGELRLAIVLGGGNLLRGATLTTQGFTPEMSDQIGLLSTVSNGLAIRSIFTEKQVKHAVFSNVKIDQLFKIKNYSAQSVHEAFEENKVVLLVGGTGKTGCTTDSAATYTAVDIGAERLLKATTVAGIYAHDPKNNNINNTFYTKINYQQILRDNLKIMDRQAIEYASQHHLPLQVFHLKYLDELYQICLGQYHRGTLVSEKHR